METTSIRVLVVEDNPSDAELLIEYLSEINSFLVRSETAERIDAAIQCLDKDEYDLVLLDLSLPDSHGLDTLSRIREKCPELPIVIMTGLDDENVAHEAARGGAQDYLHKTKLEPELLARTMRYAMERSRAERELRKHRDELEEIVQNRTADLRSNNTRLISEIEERKRAEKSLMRLAAAIEHLAEAIVVTDAESNIEYVNPAFEAMTGYTRDEVLGQNPEILRSGKHDDSFYQEFDETIRVGRTWNGHVVNRRKDGTLYTCASTTSSIQDADGNILNYVEVQRDETELRKLQDHINQTQRLESLGQLAGGVAHDFNNVLQAIFGYAHASLDEIPEGTEVHEYIREIFRAAEHAAGLTRQLLAFSRKQIMKTQPLLVTDVIESLLKMLNRLLGEDMEIEFKNRTDVGIIEADPGQVEQILINLCINARDAMPNGGRIVLEAENREIDEIFAEANPWSKAGKYVQLSVSDNGTGMPPEVADRIFEPFFTTKPEGKGTGLGLATVFGIVTQHEGFIHCYSEPGIGTTFKLYFPASERAAARDVLTTPDTFPGNGETILVVEDKENIRALAEASLKKAGYAVLTAENGLQALDIITTGQTVDLVFSDVVMPKLGGLELYSRLQGMGQGIPVLLASGYSSRIVESDLLSLATVEIIQKPYRTEELLQKIRLLLRTA